MNKTFKNHIYKMMDSNKRIMLLNADMLQELDRDLPRDYPEQYFNFGIGENNMVGAAAAMAKDGFIPVVYTCGSFLVYRAMEFIRDDVCLQNSNVKMIGMGAGVKNNAFGPTHHLTEDIAAMRVMPNLTVISPASPLEVVPALEAAIAHSGPIYFRLGKAFETEIYSSTPQFEIGKSTLIREGSDLTIIATGNIIANVIDAADLLKVELGISADIINMSTLKPIDRVAILNSAAKTHKVVTVEEHQVFGGLGGAVSEVLASSGVNARLEIIGFNDTFCTIYGWHRDLLEAYGLSVAQIFDRIKVFAQK